MTRQRTRVAALVAGCAVVAGGAFAATDALSSPAPAAASAAQSAGTGAAPAGESAQAAALSSVIADAGTSPGTTLAKRAVQLRRARIALRSLRLLSGEYGQFTIHTKKGTRSLAFERGTIVSVAGDDVTVRAAGGTTWTWLLTGSSVVREDGSRASSSALSAGERVFAGGPVTGTARDARLIVIRNPAASAKSGTASTS